MVFTNQKTKLIACCPTNAAMVKSDVRMVNRWRRNFVRPFLAEINLLTITWSAGRWMYTFRCRECNQRYERRPTALPIGPMFHTKAGNLIDTAHGIDHYESVLVYDGPRRELKCADCLLSLCVPLRLDANLWQTWLAEFANVLRDDDILRSYAELAITNTDGSIGYPESLDLSCLRCHGQLFSGRISRRCPNCGDSERIDLIKSRSIPGGQDHKSWVFPESGCDND